ncbi:MAG: 30S ribosomal protein S12 methylthiotransferase RimO [Deltaproteobacteria bacterium]|nr:30S ribosomal protein S12 methylthiotransferase RimO [Deltaproteobacteria bacterium]
MKKRKVHIVSLGCPKNLVDSEVMAAALSKDRYRIVPEARDADVILVNTCAFIGPAKEESIDEILRMAALKEGNGAVKLIVAGCLPQRYGKALKDALPEVDLFLGISEVPNIARHADSLFLTKDPSPSPGLIVRKPLFLMDAGHERLISTPPYSAYLKIAEGCSNRCSYCVIPAIRGKARSRQMDDILQEAQNLAARGVKELIMTAQDTTAYGSNLKGTATLSNLLKDIAAVEGIRWIRLLYAYPVRLDRGLLETIAREEKICKYIDIPIQHVDDEILAAMNRKGTSRRIREIIAEARKIIPHVALRTSVIVGFPGETPAKFNRLLAFIKETEFDHLGAFKYSREEGTAAAVLPRQVSERVKDARRMAIMEEQAVISCEINRSLVGSRGKVLVEGKSDIPEYPYVGRLERQAPDIDGITYIKGKHLSPGQFVDCRITDFEEYDLYVEAAP